MRNSFIWLLVLALGVVSGCDRPDNSSKSASPDPLRRNTLFRLHFCGTTRLAADTNATPWMVMGEQPAFRALWQQTLEKLARSPHQLFQRQIVTTATNDFAQAISGLLVDMTRAESFLEVTGDSNQIAEFVLAVQLAPDRAEFWQTNLLSVLESWSGGRAQRLSTGAAGWQLEWHELSNSIRLVQSGGWTLISCGPGHFPLQDKYLKSIEESGRPAPTERDSWAELFLDGPNFPGRFRGTPQPWVAKLPVAKLTLTGRDGDVRIKGDLTFNELSISRPAPWQIPTNLIREPLISFTAVRGVGAQVRDLLKAEGLLLAGAPDQYFSWAGATYPVQTLAAAPLKGATNVFHSFASQLQSRYNPYLQTAKAGALVLETNAPDAETLRWTDIPPFVTPFITTYREADRDFFFGGFHPNWGDSNVLGPAVLYHHLASQTNLIYYDWELTGTHAYSWRAIINLLLHYFEKPRLDTNSAGITWANSVSNRLGNTVTEVRQTGSNQLSLVRQGAIGLTGIELLALVHWLESSQFPVNAFTAFVQTNENLPVLPRE